MTKQQLTKNQPRTKQKKKTVARVSTPRPRPRSQRDTMLVRQICGLSDPFCSHANGAKYPDPSGVRTLPFTRRLRTVLATDASGYANLLINPQWAFQPHAAVNVWTGNAVTSWSNYAGAGAIAGVIGYRIVSTGYLCRRISAPLSSSGLLHIRQYAPETLSTAAPIDTTTFNASNHLTIALQDAKEVAVMLERTSQMPQTFYNPNNDVSAVASSSTHGFAYSTISLSGAPATTACLDIEIIINFEVIFEDSSDLAQVATPAVPANSTVTEAAAKVTSTINPISNGGPSLLGKQIIHAATTALATYMLGPAAGRMTSHALAITVD